MVASRFDDEAGAAAHVEKGSRAIVLGRNETGHRRDALATAGRMAGLGDDPRVVRPPEDRVTFWDVVLGSSSARVLARLTAPLDPNPAPRVKYVVPW